jgi:hypothetical protein
MTVDGLATLYVNGEQVSQQEFSPQSVGQGVDTDFHFKDGGGNNSINDGGRDQYDGGNRLSSDSAFEIDYSLNTVAQDNFGTGSQNGAVYQSGIFASFVTNNTSDTFKVTGDVGADGAGTEDLLDLGQYKGYQAIVCRTHDGWDPSIHRVFIYEANDAVGANIDGNTNTDDLTIHGLAGVQNFAYFTVFANEQTPFDQASLETFFKNAVDQVLLDDQGQAQSVEARFQELLNHELEKIDSFALVESEALLEAARDTS